MNDNNGKMSKLSCGFVLITLFMILPFMDCSFKAYKAHKASKWVETTATMYKWNVRSWEDKRRQLASNSVDILYTFEVNGEKFHFPDKG